jgi:glycosyltransferase involved in cell wall biosynthesis
MQTIDVVMITKNSDFMLERCIESIYATLPVQNLIVIDGFSTDRTLDIINKLNKKFETIKVFSLKGSRALARETGISHVSTDWFMFVDSDIILSKDWYKMAKKQIKDDIGAVWGVNIDVVPGIRDKWFIRLQSFVANYCFSIRGGTHDTLIRYEAVKDIKIPNYLNAYEDAYIINWIKKKGYQTIIGEGLYCFHYKPSGNWNGKKGLSHAIEEVRCGLVYSHAYKFALFYPFFMFFWFLQFTLQLSKNIL